MNKDNTIEHSLNKKILIMDGAMGTMIQDAKLTEEDFRGKKFSNSKINLFGNNDILNITQEDLIYQIHTKYLECGADIIETNTFNSTSISQKDYGCEDYCFDLNFRGAMIAKKAVKDYNKRYPDQQKFIAGVLGPTNRTCSMSPDVNDPGFRNIKFDDLFEDYKVCVEAFLKANVDLILVETVFDTLNAKAALMAIKHIETLKKISVPIMISATITDLSGRTLSGQTIEGFYNSIIHSNPISVGLNCALGPKELEPYLIELDRISEVFISCHPNAGLPNAFGEYEESPELMGKYVGDWSKNGYINIIGGCCGTTPEHVKIMKQKVQNNHPRKLKKISEKLRLSGLEAFNI